MTGLPFIDREQLTRVAPALNDGVAVMICTEGYWASAASDGEVVSFYRWTPQGPEYCASGDFSGWLGAFAHCRFEALSTGEFQFPVRWPTRRRSPR